MIHSLFKERNTSNFYFFLLHWSIIKSALKSYFGFVWHIKKHQKNAILPWQPKLFWKIKSIFSYVAYKLYQKLESESVYIGFSLFIGLNLMKKNWGGWKLSSLTTRGLCCSVKFYTCHVQFDLEVMNGRDGGILSQLTVLGLRKGYNSIGLFN